MIGGWVTQVGALTLIPITIVQPALAVSVLSLLLIGVLFFGQSANTREVLAAVAIVVGVAGMVAASPKHSSSHAGPLTLAIGMSVLAAVALAPYAMRGHHRFGSMVALSAGLAYAWTGFSSKFLADGVSKGSWVPAVIWLAATATAAAVGLLSEMTALQKRSPINVFPVVLVVQIVVAVVLSPLLTGETKFPGPALIALLLVSLIVLGFGTRALAGSSAVENVISTEDEGQDAVAAG